MWAWLVLAPAAGCVAAKPAPPPVNTADLAIAPDFIADSLLVDVRSLEPAIVASMRYATPNNFTGAPLPGYLANRAFLVRRELHLVAATGFFRIRYG